MNTPPRTQSTVKTSTPLRGATEFASPGVSSLSAAASSPRVYSRRSTSSFDTGEPSRSRFVADCVLFVRLLGFLSWWQFESQLRIIYVSLSTLVSS